MADTESNLIICGGMLLTLLCKTKNEVAPAHDKVKSVSYENSDEDIFEALIKVLFDEFVIQNERSFKTKTNEYKHCKNRGMRYFPFRDSDRINKLKLVPLSLKNVWNMGELVRQYIALENRQELLNAVIELLEKASNIDETYQWHISENEIVNVKDIRKADEIYIDWLLCDIWRYIVIYSKDNKAGFDSYLEWFEKVDDDGGKYHFSSNIGFNQYKKFIIHEMMKKTIPEVAPKENNEDIETVVQEENTSEETQYKPNKTIEEQILKSGQAIAKVWGNAIKTLEFGMQTSSELKEFKGMLYVSSCSEGELMELLYNRNIDLIQIDRSFLYNDVYGDNYFEFTEECHFTSIFGDNMRRCVEVRIPMNGYEIVGRTSSENWKSKSYMDNILYAGRCRCNGIFQIISKNDNLLIVQFIYLRR